MSDLHINNYTVDYQLALRDVLTDSRSTYSHSNRIALMEAIHVAILSIGGGNRGAMAPLKFKASP